MRVPREVERLVKEGGRCRPTMRPRSNAGSEERPEDVDARVRLLGYYKASVRASRRGRHLEERLSLGERLVRGEEG